MTYEIIHADVIEWAKNYNGEKFHALFCDPPYHLQSIVDRFGKDDSAPAQYGRDGAFGRVSKGFMGKEWDGGNVAFDPETWRLLGQHLYPGAFGMAYAASRGWHRLAVAIEDGGMIIHPTMFLWVQCLSDDTKILTKDGWKGIDELSLEDEIACWNKDNDMVEFHFPKDKFVGNYSGEMFNYHTKDTDQLITPNHRVYHQKFIRKQKDYARKGKWSDWLVDEAQNIEKSNRGLRLPVSSYHNGSGIGGVDIAGLIGLVWTEGGYSSQDEGIRIYQSSSNAENVALIRECLDVNLDDSYSEYTRVRKYKDREYTEYCWYFNNDISDYIKEYLPDKKPTWKLLFKMTLQEKEAFLHMCMIGDGSFSSNQFYQKDCHVWFSTLLSMTGRKGNINKSHNHISIQDNKRWVGVRYHNGNINRVQYNSRIWCIEVPTGAFFAMRNDKIFITGNSQGFPKATRIDSQIDRALGEEQKVIGSKLNRAPTAQANGWGNSGVDNWDEKKHGTQSMNITVPATDLAKAWQGHRYGLQALKPTTEPIVVFSKPKEWWYNSIWNEMNIASDLLENIWNRTKNNTQKSEIEKNLRMACIELLRMQKEQDQTSMENGLSAEIAKKLSIKREEYYKIIVESVVDIVLGNVILNTEKNLQNEHANGAILNSMQDIQIKNGNFVVENVCINQKNDLCWKILSGTGIDITTVVDMLLYNLGKVKLDLSMIWLWNMLWAGLCEKANKSIIEMDKKMITGLKILNYSLQKLMQENIQLGVSFTREQELYVSDVTRNFIGLLIYPMAQEHTVPNVVVEPIILFQKPYEGRPVENMMETGAGALNIDKGRIGISENDDPRLGGKGSFDTSKAAKKVYDGGYTGERIQSSPLGRWPCNFLLSHHPDCRIVGESDSSSYTINRFTDGAKPWGNGAGHEFESEEIDGGKQYEWECVENCPIKSLNDQTGELKSGDPGGFSRNNDGGYHGNYGNIPLTGYGDSGGASRFFYQSDWSYEILEQIENANSAYYCAKAGKSERNAGLDESVTSRSSYRPNDPDENTIRQRLHRSLPRTNPHPTVKPIELNRYLASLLLPPFHYQPHRRILVPFAGVGSEMIGAMLAGWDSITGIEMTDEYIPIAEQRLKFWSGWSEKGYSDPKEIIKLDNQIKKAEKKLEEERDEGQMSIF